MPSKSGGDPRPSGMGVLVVLGVRSDPLTDEAFRCFLMNGGVRMVDRNSFVHYGRIRGESARNPNHSGLSIRLVSRWSVTLFGFEVDAVCASWARPLGCNYWGGLHQKEVVQGYRNHTRFGCQLKFSVGKHQPVTAIDLFHRLGYLVDSFAA